MLGNSESPVGVALLRTINCKWEEILVSAFYGQYDTASHFKRKDVSQIIIHTLEICNIGGENNIEKKNN